MQGHNIQDIERLLERAEQRCRELKRKRAAYITDVKHMKAPVALQSVKQKPRRHVTAPVHGKAGRANKDGDWRNNR